MSRRTEDLPGLLACGLTVSYAATGMFAFAHGAIGFTGALIFFQVTAANVPVSAALAATLAAAAVLGWLLHRLMFRALATAGQTAQTVAMIGLIIALPALGLFLVEALGLPSVTQGAVPRGLGPRPAHVWRAWGGVGRRSIRTRSWSSRSRASPRWRCGWCCGIPGSACECVPRSIAVTSPRCAASPSMPSRRRHGCSAACWQRWPECWPRRRSGWTRPPSPRCCSSRPPSRCSGGSGRFRSPSRLGSRSASRRIWWPATSTPPSR